MDRAHIDTKLDNIRQLAMLAQSSNAQGMDGSLQKRVEIIKKQADEVLAALAKNEQMRCLQAEANRRGDGPSCTRGHNWVEHGLTQRAYHTS